MYKKAKHMDSKISAFVLTEAEAYTLWMTSSEALLNCHLSPQRQSLCLQFMGWRGANRATHLRSKVRKGGNRASALTLLPQTHQSDVSLFLGRKPGLKFSFRITFQFRTPFFLALEVIIIQCLYFCLNFISSWWSFMLTPFTF